MSTVRAPCSGTHQHEVRLRRYGHIDSAFHRRCLQASYYCYTNQTKWMGQYRGRLAPTFYGQRVGIYVYDYFMSHVYCQPRCSPAHHRDHRGINANSYCTNSQSARKFIVISSLRHHELTQLYTCRFSSHLVDYNTLPRHASLYSMSDQDNSCCYTLQFYSCLWVKYNSLHSTFSMRAFQQNI